MPGGTSVGQISLDLGLNDAKFKKQTRELEAATKKQFSGLTSFLANFLANVASNLLNKLLSEIGNFVKSAINLASDLEEVQNVVDTVFTTMSDKVSAFAQSAMESFGLSELVAKQYMGQLGAMAKAFGYSEEEAYNLARSITGLTGDVASFYNLTSEEAFTKLKSIFTGETESLKSLGVVMTQSALDAFALANGFEKTTADMSESEKVALRYKFVLNQLSASHGDFAKTSDSWANQIRVLSLRWDTLKATLGEGFIAALTPVVQMLNRVIVKMQDTAQAFTTLVKIVMGVSDQTSGVGEATSGASDATSEIADNMKATEKSAEAAKKSLLGFDEINKLASPGNDDPSATGDIGSFDWGFEEGADKTAGTLTQIVLDKTEELKQMFESVAKFFGFNEIGDAISAGMAQINFDALNSSLDALWASLVRFGDSVVSDGLVWLFEEVLVPLSVWTVNELLPEFINTLAAAFDFLTSAINALKPMWDAIWTGFFLPIASWTGGAIISILQLLASCLTAISNWVDENQVAFQVMTGIVLGFFAAWEATELLAFIVNAGGATAALTALTTALYANTIAKIKDKIETLYLVGLYAKDFVVSCAKTIAQLASQTAAWIAQTAAQVASKIALVASTVAMGAWNAICAIGTAVTTAFGAAMAFLTSPIGLVVVAITAIIAIVVLLVKHWDQVKEAAKKCWDGIVAGAQAAWGGIKAILNGMITGFEAFINFFIKGINFLIGAINKISFEVPDWVPGIGGSKVGFNLKEVAELNLPHLAQGGFVAANQPTLAIVGDNKREGEIIAPESKIAEAVARGVAQAIASIQHLIGSSNEMQQPMQVVVQVGDEVLVDKVITGINNENRRAGRLVITV